MHYPCFLCSAIKLSYKIHHSLKSLWMHSMLVFSVWCRSESKQLECTEKKQRKNFKEKITVIKWKVFIHNLPRIYRKWIMWEILACEYLRKQKCKFLLNPKLQEQAVVYFSPQKGKGPLWVAKWCVDVHKGSINSQRNLGEQYLLGRSAPGCFPGLQ